MGAMHLPRRRPTTPTTPDAPDALDASAARDRRPLRLLALGLVVALAAVTTYVVLTPDDEAEQPGALFSTGSTPIRLPVGLVDRPADEAPGTRGPAVTAEPLAGRRLVIPTLGVDSAIVPIEAPGGTLTPPDDAQQVGWWSAGAAPGDEQGSALVTGHTLSSGSGALQDLETLAPGDRMTVRTPDGRLAYEVQEVQVFDKGTVAAEAQELFSQTSEGRLVVITCEDYNGSVYLSNVVVTATPVGPTSATF
jgi:LPXTG-site transpeptidase (sortase) family protein